MFKVLEGATAPTRATKYSAMVDLYANSEVVIGAGETKIVPLGVNIDLEKVRYIGLDQNYGIYDDLCDSEKIEHFLWSHYIELHPRSSLRAKGLIIGVGVIDLDYPDELGLIVHNPIKSIIIDAESNIVHIGVNKLENICEYTINKGDKVAQCTLKEHKGYLLGIESEVERLGGFGSTDKEIK